MYGTCRRSMREKTQEAKHTILLGFTLTYVSTVVLSVTLCQKRSNITLDAEVLSVTNKKGDVVRRKRKAVTQADLGGKKKK